MHYIPYSLYSFEPTSHVVMFVWTMDWSRNNYITKYKNCLMCNSNVCIQVFIIISKKLIAIEFNSLDTSVNVKL